MKVIIPTPPHLQKAVQGGVFNTQGTRVALASKLCEDKDLVYLPTFNNTVHSGGSIIILNPTLDDIDHNPTIKATAEQVKGYYNILHADLVALPDVYGNGLETTTAVYTSPLLGVVPPSKRLITPHGNTFKEWVDCFKSIKHGIYGFRAVGIPSYFDEETKRKVLTFIARSHLAKHYDFYLLGIKKHPYEEVETALKYIPHLKGLVTVLPLISAYNNNHEIPTKINPFFSDYPANKAIRLVWDVDINPHFIQHNIRKYQRKLLTLSRTAKTTGGES